MLRRLAVLLTVLCGLCASGARAGVQTVAIPVAGLSSAPSPLTGLLFQPAGPGPHAAVVMLHGCGGAYGRDGTLNPRHRMWGELLAEAGYAALMLDSFTARGVRELCTQKMSERSLKEADRVGDAFAALAWLLGRADIDPARISLLGWSHGGGTVLATINRKPEQGAGFAAAVAFYPGCSARAKSPENFRPQAPLLLLIGEADDWTPAAPCQALAAAVAASGEPMQIVTYPGAFHDFDNPALKGPRLRQDVPNGVQPGRGVTTAPDAPAREDAKRRVLAFLAAPMAASSLRP